MEYYDIQYAADMTNTTEIFFYFSLRTLKNPCPRMINYRLELKAILLVSYAKSLGLQYRVCKSKSQSRKCFKKAVI